MTTTPLPQPSRLLKTLPANLQFQRTTPVFTEESVPSVLLRAHRTKAGTWGRIVVLEGRLLYRIHTSPAEEHILDPDIPGIIEPQAEHEVAALGKARFRVEFFH